MALHTVSVDAARVRTGSWRGSPDLAYLVPVSTASTLTRSALERIRSQLRDSGYQAVVTAAVGPNERAVLLADGFVDHESLHLLSHDLRALEPTPQRARGLRRGFRRDYESILEVDSRTFDEFWQLDRDGLKDAIDATPTARLRVVRDPRVMGYAISGRAGAQGYLQRLAVDPERQGQGLGRDLVTDSLQWLRRHGSTICWVNTQIANETAHGLYLDLGFMAAAHQLTVLRRDL